MQPDSMQTLHHWGPFRGRTLRDLPTSDPASLTVILYLIIQERPFLLVNDHTLWKSYTGDKPFLLPGGDKGAPVVIAGASDIMDSVDDQDPHITEAEMDAENLRLLAEELLPIVWYYIFWVHHGIFHRYTKPAFQPLLPYSTSSLVLTRLRRLYRAKLDSLTRLKLPETRAKLAKPDLTSSALTEAILPLFEPAPTRERQYFSEWLDSSEAQARKRKGARRPWNPFVFEWEFGCLENGTVDWSLADVLRLLTRCYGAFEEALGDEKQYFGGESPSRLDAVIFGHVAFHYFTRIHCPTSGEERPSLLRHLLSQAGGKAGTEGSHNEHVLPLYDYICNEFPKLSGYCQRMADRFLTLRCPMYKRCVLQVDVDEVDVSPECARPATDRLERELPMKFWDRLTSIQYWVDEIISTRGFGVFMVVGFLGLARLVCSVRRGPA